MRFLFLILWDTKGETPKERVFGRSLESAGKLDKMVIGKQSVPVNQYKVLAQIARHLYLKTVARTP